MYSFTPLQFTVSGEGVYIEVHRQCSAIWHIAVMRCNTAEHCNKSLWCCAIVHCTALQYPTWSCLIRQKCAVQYCTSWCSAILHYLELPNQTVGGPTIPTLPHTHLNFVILVIFFCLFLSRIVISESNIH